MNTLMQELTAIGVKEYNAKEYYKLNKEIGSIKVDATNRIVTSSNGGNSLKVIQGDKAIYVPLRKDVPVNKAEYTIGEFEAIETFEFNGTEVVKGSKKAFAY